jgi:hypothetical protein
VRSVAREGRHASCLFCALPAVEDPCAARLCGTYWKWITPTLQPGNTLQTIELWHNSQAGGEIVLAIARHCPLLETCGIRCFHSLTDAAIVELAQGCPLLSALTLLEVGVTDVGIAALAKQCDRLEFLQIRSCERVTTDVVCVLAEYCKKLKRLMLCRGFTGQDFSKLVNAGTTVHCA